jgi:tetratricopeptide (TPR) repeat protein
MSPEQVKGEKVDGRSDLFSVGCMLFELVAGRRPFHSDNLMAIFYKITHEGANFNLIPQGADYDALMPILRKALAKNPGERYQTAFEFAVDLREWLKTHATTASTQNVLESLVTLEAPTHPPLPLTDAPGVTVVPEAGATVEIDRRGPRRPGATRLASAPPLPRTPVRPRPAARSSVLPWVAMALALVAVAVAGWLAWRSQQASGTPPATQAAAPPVTTPPPTMVATPAPPLPTAAPAPTFEDAASQAAASVRAARAAFGAGDYDRAVAAAQAALREDGENATAQRILNEAMIGQRAAAQVRAAESALGQDDLATAETRLGDALRIAPWDPGAVALVRRLEEAKVRARREAGEAARAARTAEIQGLLAEATASLERRQFEAAIATYSRVLELDPGNQAATIGKSNALTAKTVAEAAPSGPRPGPTARSLVQGRTEAKGNEQDSLVGFEDSAGVEVKRGTQAAVLPGKVQFDAAPPAPKPGERFRVRVFLANEGSQPIQLAAMQITTTTDGKPQRGGVPPATTTVAPGQRALVYQTPGEMLWKEGTQSWTMEIVLHTTKGETYRNTLSWR